MSHGTTYVEAPQKDSPDPVLAVIERKAGTETKEVRRVQDSAQQEIIIKTAEAEKSYKQLTSQPSDSGSTGFGVVMDTVSDALGLGCASSTLQFLDERLTDHTKSADVVNAANNFGGMFGSADTNTSFENMFRSINSGKDGATLPERSSITSFSLVEQANPEITSGIETSKQVVAKLNNECQLAMSIGMANEKVYNQAKALRAQNIPEQYAGAPIPGGMGGGRTSNVNSATYQVAHLHNTHNGPWRGPKFKEPVAEGTGTTQDDNWTST